MTLHALIYSTTAVRCLDTHFLIDDVQQFSLRSRHTNASQASGTGLQPDEVAARLASFQSRRLKGTGNNQVMINIV